MELGVGIRSGPFSQKCSGPGHCFVEGVLGPAQTGMKVPVAAAETQALSPLVTETLHALLLLWTWKPHFVQVGESYLLSELGLKQKG